MTRFRMAILTLIFLSGAVSLEAQGNQQAALVRSLNDSVLQLHAQLQSAGPGGAAGLRAQGEALLAQRAAAFSALVQQDPGAALQLAFDQNLAATLASAFPQAAGQFESRGIWEGPVDYIVFDDETMMNHRKDIHLAAANGEVLDIYFPNGVEPPGLKCGEILRVEGVRSGNRVAAANGDLSGGSVAGAGCTSQGTQNVAVILISFPGIPLPSNVTNSGVHNIFFASTGRSVKRYWEDASYGKASAAGNVFGPYELSQSYSCDDYYNMRTAAIAAADADAVFTSYTRIMIVFPNPGGCGWAGLGTLGCSSIGSQDGTFTASTSWLLASYMGSIDNGVKLATHEGGHNLSLHHASSRDFAAEALGNLSAAGTLSEYGDVFSTMGSWNLGHYAAPHKQQISWFSSGNVETLEASATRTVQPFEILTGGLQALKIRRGTGNNSWLWIEYRKALGDYDATLPSQIFSGATIHYADSSTGTHTHLLDFTPETSSWSDPALAAGKSWTDPYSNVSIQVVSVDASGVTLNVTYGALPCVTANPTVTISPSSASTAAGGEAYYQNLIVYNNDSAGCTSKSFDLSTLLHDAINNMVSHSTTFGSAPLPNVAPGGSASTTMRVFIPTGTSVGSYTVDATANDGASSDTGSAGLMVVAPPTITVSVSGTTYAPRSTVSMSATVLSGGSPAPGASVSFTMTKPNNAATTKTATTNSSGVATWSYKLGPNDPNGQYWVAGQATYNSMPTNTGSDDFWVGSGPCVPANPTVAISPASAIGPAGSNFDYTVTVTNNDSSSCSVGTFSLSSTLPSGWATLFSPASLSIGPGQSATSTMTKTVPADATGSSDVNAFATKDSYSGSSTATFTVGVAPQLTVSVSVNGSSFAPRSTVTMTANVANGGPVAGASVVFTLTKPNGSTTTKTATTNSSGVATSTYKLGPRDPTGLYSVSATATHSGSSASSSQNATFTVQ